MAFWGDAIDTMLKQIRRLSWPLYFGGLCLLSMSLKGDVRVSNNWPGTVWERDYATGEKQRVTALGPLMEQRWEAMGTAKTFRPILTEFENPTEETRESYFLYPLFGRKQSKYESRWNIFNLIKGNRKSSSQTDDELTIFPFYKSWRGDGPGGRKRALFPIVGRVDNFFWHDSISWFFFPLWLHSTKGDEDYYSMPWPFIRWRKGPKTGGVGIWPFMGHYWKKGSYDHKFALWFIMYVHRDHLERDVPTVKKGFLPFFASESSEKVESRTWCWPFFGYVHKKDPEYRETHYLWPLFVQGSGENERATNRWAPFYTHSTKHGVDKKWWLWPLLKKKHWKQDGLTIEQFQFLYFVIWGQRQYSERDPSFMAEKSHFWPIHSYWDNGAGKKQFQFFSPLEPFFQANQVVRTVYSPLFSLYRFTQEMPGHTRRSFLFNLITYEKSPVRTQFTLGPLLEIEASPSRQGFSLLNGAFGLSKESGKKTFKILWMRF